MPRSAQLLVITLLVTLVGCPAPSGSEGVATAADTAAVMALRDAEVASLAADNPTFGHLADDVHIMPPGEPAIHGVAATREWLAGFRSQFRASVNYVNSSLVFSGDLAIETYTGSLTMTPVAGGDTITEVLKGIHVYRRGPDGTWRMVQDIWNSDQPAPVQ